MYKRQLLDDVEKKRYQPFTGLAMCLAQVTRYDMLYATSQLSRTISKASKTHMAAATHLLRSLAGTMEFSISYKRGGLNLTAFSDANWGNNPDKIRSMSSYLMTMAKMPVASRRDFKR